jgi:chromosome segregation ATPase
VGARSERAKAKSGAKREKGHKSGLAMMARLAALERERDDLKEELARTQARVRQLEAGHAQVRDRIAWALDALHGILEGKG